MSMIPEPVPPIPPQREGPSLRREFPLSAAFSWLAAGWADFKVRPGLSLAYGIFVFLVSIVVVYGLSLLAFDYILFPALAGFMVVGPALAIGLYEKSRRLTENRSLSLGSMLLVKPRSGGQVLFMGVLLMLLLLLWLRAAVILYALFFGLLPFPGIWEIVVVLFTTETGWALLAVGSAIGGLFAAFSFAISAFAAPMLLNERTDALTAMGTSMALVWNNLGVMITWGAIVVLLVGLSLVTGLLGLIVAFPVLGHGTWHAYMAMRGSLITENGGEEGGGGGVGAR